MKVSICNFKGTKYCNISIIFHGCSIFFNSTAKNTNVEKWQRESLILFIYIRGGIGQRIPGLL
jgi:hypothetical protein